MSDVLLDVMVQKREMHTEGVVVLDLVDPNGLPLPGFEAGAHIDLHLNDQLIRQYSLCNDPQDSGVYRVGILKDPNSRGGSIAAHEQLVEGRQLKISAPRNLFPLNDQASKSLLVGGGIGITPMIAMAYSLHHQGKDFELYYCGRSRVTSAFVEDLEQSPFASRVHFCFDDEVQLDVRAVLNDANSHTHLYTCGPNGFMDWVMQSARECGFAEERIHKEFFQVDVETGGEAFEVVAEASGVTVMVQPDESIAQALNKAGLKIKVSCEQGTCGTCLCDVLEGTPEHRDVFLTDEEKEDNDQMLICCSRSKTDRLVLDI